MTNISLLSGWAGDGQSFATSYAPQFVATYPAITVWNQTDTNNAPTPALFFATVDDTTLASLQADSNYNSTLVIL